ncbi:hypothetical protein NJC38_14205 [Pseudomonas sp. 21LCFQ010]|uniref:hypothetical protein n=1 Tax=Pseudomonas sp. 21LCFQ010 TaxID=2957506 RepID=UPI0020969481|nr:hypothetical protein [Pseudomonas sp. 21LCFQ010]MCO8163313.1 hypothetical protein [Pseudomonas sp. 21LCFQ010]
MIMAIPIGSSEAESVISDARGRLQAYAGAILSFVRLRKIFEVENFEGGDGRLAEIIELLSNRRVDVLNYVYFYVDDEYGLVRLGNDVVNHYLKFGELYHPISNAVIDDPDVESRVIIEFEVVL